VCDKSLYTGITNDVEKRVAAHNKGTASKYTRCRRPVKIVYLEQTRNPLFGKQKRIRNKVFFQKKEK
jgi:putative endonuclease